MTQLQRFLVFIGLSAITLTDKKANVELTEEQMESVGQKLHDFDAVQSAKNDLEAELASEKQINVSTQSKLAETQAKIAEMEAELAILRKTPGATSAISPKGSDGNAPTDPCKIDIPEDGSIQEQLAAFNKAIKG